MRLFPFVFMLFAGCTIMQSNDENRSMHEHMFRARYLPLSPSVRPLIKNVADTNEHRVNWKRAGATVAKPLLGLRIALDPGHMGGAPWDERGGKYLVNTAGTRLSEGVMALILARLLENDLRTLGAEVMVDRPDTGAITARDYKDFAGASHAYFQRLDLDARAEKILAFHPDLTLILHFDSHIDDVPPNPDRAKTLCNDTKAYVPGAFDIADFDDDVDRALFSILWRNPSVWNDSVRLSREITGAIHRQLGIPLNNEYARGIIPIEPGVLARNLRLQRRLAGLVSSYLECLCYEAPAEFAAFSAHDFVMKVGGADVPYSKRMVQLEAAIRDGVVAFVTHAQ